MSGEELIIKKDDFRKNYAKEYFHQIHDILDMMEEHLPDKINIIADILLDACNNRKTVFIMGNGGSAATASHFTGDLSKGTNVKGCTRFKAIALTDNIPNLLAWANDQHYDDIFVEQLVNLMEPGDIVIGISGSGNSQNVINAIEYANEHGGITIGFSGYDGGVLKQCVKENIHVPSNCMQQVEDIHLIIEHMLTSMIKKEQQEIKKI